MKSQFEKELEELVNRYSKENDSDTPDFILARYLNACLDNFSAAIKDREQWYGREKHVEDLPLAQPTDVIIGECNEDKSGQKNVFIGNGTARLIGGMGSTTQSMFSQELQADMLRLQKTNENLLEKLKKI